MKLTGFSIFGITLVLLLTGCASISPSDASEMSSKELCKVLMGIGIPPKDRRVVNAEVQYRGISCRDAGSQSYYNQQGGGVYRRPQGY